MTEQELKQELKLYQGMYYTLYNSIENVLELTANRIIIDILTRAKYRSRDMLLFKERPPLTRLECADLLRRVTNAMSEGVLPMDVDFINICVDKCLEWQDAKLPTKEEYEKKISELLETLHEAEKKYTENNQ